MSMFINNGNNSNNINNLVDLEEKVPIYTYAIFFNNGNILDITAASYEWDIENGILEFYDTPEDDDEGTSIASFKLDTLYGVAMRSVNENDNGFTDFKLHNEIAGMLPCFREDMNDDKKE